MMLSSLINIFCLIPLVQFTNCNFLIQSLYRHGCCLMLIIIEKMYLWKIKIFKRKLNHLVIWTSLGIFVNFRIKNLNSSLICETTKRSCCTLKGQSEKSVVTLLFYFLINIYVCRMSGIYVFIFTVIFAIVHILQHIMPFSFYYTS